MHSTELREKVRGFAETAKQAQGRRSPADIASGRKLYDLRREFLADSIPSNHRLKYNTDGPDWNSWPSIAEFFGTYYVAMVELTKQELACNNARRLDGI
jgi:hypothetical protein